MPRLILLMLLLAAVPAASQSFPESGRIVFLGDSITYSGGYIHYLDLFQVTRFGGPRVELLNLGLPSEGVTGLSEPEHPFPRPNVHERLERVLRKTRPNVVVACYGMNDGIYYPFSEERFGQYQQGIRRLVEAVKRSGARLVLLTPPPFDPEPVRARTLPASAAKFSWMAPYAGYDDVLARYSRWLLTLRGEGVQVVDLHTPINRHLAAMRAEAPGFRLAADGVHVDANGHLLIAAEVLEAFRVPAEVDAAVVDARSRRARRGDVTGISVRDGALSFRWRTRLPMPADPEWDARLLRRLDFQRRFNRHGLTVTNLPRERYRLNEAERLLGEVTRAELEAGLDLLRFPELTTNRRSAELLKLVRERQQLLGPAWLTDVGHTRPDTPKGLPLEEAQRRAGALEAEIRRLAQPVTLALRLEPVGD